MSINSRLFDHFIASQLISTVEARAVVKRLRQYGGRLVDTLLGLEGVSEVALAKALGQFHRHQVVDIGRVKPKRAALELTTGEFCLRHNALPFSVDRQNGTILIAVADPSEAEGAAEELARASRARVQMYVAPARMLKALIEQVYGLNPARRARPSNSNSRTEVSTIAKIPDLEEGRGRRLSGASWSEARGEEPQDIFGNSRSNSRGISGLGGPNGGEELRSVRQDVAVAQEGLSALQESFILLQDQFTAVAEQSDAAAQLPQVVTRHNSAISSMQSDLDELKQTQQKLLLSLHRIEASMGLDVSFVREIVRMLIEQGVIDDEKYLERLADLR